MCIRDRFVITPPLFAMQGKKENTLRIIDATNNQLPQDRESLFWMNVKAIPDVYKRQAQRHAHHRGDAPANNPQRVGE